MELSPSSSLTIENIYDNGVDFIQVQTVDTSDGNYISTISGNSDAFRTPFIQADGTDV